MSLEVPNHMQARIGELITAEMNAADFRQEREDRAGRPSYMLRPRLFRDGDQWCALLGENLQEGIAGFGKSPKLAYEAFDEAWIKRLDEDTKCPSCGLMSVVESECTECGAKEE